MNLNATLLAQLVVFFILAWFTMRFVWPPIMSALDERVKKIAEGLEASEKNKSQLLLTENKIKGERFSSRTAESSPDEDGVHSLILTISDFSPLLLSTTVYRTADQRHTFSS